MKKGPRTRRQLRKLREAKRLEADKAHREENVIRNWSRAHQQAAWLDVESIYRHRLENKNNP